MHLRALNARGEPFEFCAFGLMAQCIQHEIDHLDGDKLFLVYLLVAKAGADSKEAVVSQREGSGELVADEALTRSVASNTPRARAPDYSMIRGPRDA